MTDGHLEDHVGELDILCVMLKGLSLITKTIYYEKHFQILALPLMVSFGDNSVLGGAQFPHLFFLKMRITTLPLSRCFVEGGMNKITHENA